MRVTGVRGWILERGRSGGLPSLPRLRVWGRPSLAKLFLLVVPLAAVVTLAGITLHGARSFAAEHDRRVLPGAVVGGVDLTGLDRATALARLREAVAPRLDRPITVRWGTRSWTVTLRQLGGTDDAEAVIDRLLGETDRLSAVDLLRYRWLGERLETRATVGVLLPDPAPLQAFVGRVARTVDTPVRDASLDTSDGWLRIAPSQVGRKVDQQATLATLRHSLLGSGDSGIELPVTETKPAVTESAFEKVLLLRQVEHRLYLYERGQVTRSWLVATGTGGFPTPTGTHKIVAKRFRPTWVNPAPSGWGKNMPARIGPGPKNPLGERALNWSAPAIRFHGTANVDSLGRDASHGCVRLANRDVIELYDLVDVGTTIVSLRA